MPIRIGLIGAGDAGRACLESASAIENVQVAAVCDNDRALAESVAEPFGAATHINFRTLIEAERLDAALVCLPPFARGEPEVLAARAGVHLISSPIAASVEKAREVQKEIETSGVVTAVACPWRFLSGTDRAMERLKDRKIALVQGCRFGPIPPAGWRRRRESCGGYFVQHAVDLVDLARYLAGDVTAVCAMMSEGIAGVKDDEYDIEDALAGVLRFRNGATGEIVSCDVSPRRRSYLTVVADGLDITITRDWYHVREQGTRTRVEQTGDPLQDSLKAFLKAVKSGRTDAVRCDYADAVTTLQVTLAAVESAQTGKVVSL